MFRMSTVIIAICIVTAQTIHRRDTTNVQKRIIDNYLSHLQDKQLDDPAFVRILEIIAGKSNDTEHCGLMGELECKLFLSTSSAVVHHQISNRDVGSSFNTIMRGFVSKIVQTHFPKASAMIKDVFSNNRTIPSFVDRFQTSADILVLKTLAKVNSGISGIQKYKIPMATITSIIFVFLFVLIIAKAASACEKIKETRAKRKAVKMDRYFAMRMKPIIEA